MKDFIKNDFPFFKILKYLKIIQPTIFQQEMEYPELIVSALNIIVITNTQINLGALYRLAQVKKLEQLPVYDNKKRASRHKKSISKTSESSKNSTETNPPDAVTVESIVNTTIELIDSKIQDKKTYDKAMINLVKSQINPGDVIGIRYGDYQRGLTKNKIPRLKRKIDLFVDIPLETGVNKSKRDNPGKILISECHDQESTHRAFANSVSVVFAAGFSIKPGRRTHYIKPYNIKVNSNGNFQITGCKTMEQCIEAIKYLFNHLQEIEKMKSELGFIGEEEESYMKEISPKYFPCIFSKKDFESKIFMVNKMKKHEAVVNLDKSDLTNVSTIDKEYKMKFITNETTIPIQAVINIVMKNHVFSISKIFKDGVNRFCLSNYVTKFGKELQCEDYYNNLKHSGVNIKYPYNNQDELYDLLTFNINEMNKCEFQSKGKITPDLYYTLLSVQGIKKLNKKKYHTFIVFESGKVIQSGGNVNIDQVFKKFINSMIEFKNFLSIHGEEF